MSGNERELLFSHARAFVFEYPGLMDILASRPHPDLATLSYRYAAALDQRDLRSALAVFHPDAVLRARPPGRNHMVLSGHAELAKLIKAVSHWPRTFHLVGQGLYEFAHETAVGEVYSVAHHFSSAEPRSGDDYVMFIRYHDRYVRGSGRWLISERIVVTDAVEYREVGS
ncbi:nuclear transport factor 2 family protein [Mycobacterium sp. NPDC051804]|uniref:nuclear transport factor 2 family protein n=1 Tax=Mycobacterium sp. NPDC051804 TaxID=3364295 RepID=UPI00379C8CE6